MSALAEAEEQPMPRGKKHGAEAIVVELRQVEVAAGPGPPMADAIRAVEGTAATCCRRRQEVGGLKLDPVQRPKALEAENTRLGKALANLRPEKRILEGEAGPWPQAA